MEALILLIFSIKFVNGVFIILFLKKSMYIFSWNALLVGKLVHHQRLKYQGRNISYIIVLHSCMTMHVFKIILNILRFICVYIRHGDLIKHFKPKRIILYTQLLSILTKNRLFMCCFFYIDINKNVNHTRFVYIIQFRIYTYQMVCDFVIYKLACCKYL